MSRGSLARLRVFAPLFAALGSVAGQTVASMAMPMAMEMPQHAAASGQPMTDPGWCPACPKRKRYAGLSRSRLRGSVLRHAPGRPPGSAGRLVARAREFPGVGAGWGDRVEPDLGLLRHMARAA